MTAPPPHPIPPSPRAPAAVFACMRNEGIFLVEWLAYHRVIGFDRVVVCSNDCDDLSGPLLDALAAGGALDHLPNPVPAGARPQATGMARVMAHLEPTGIEWLCHIDADEFLNIGLGQGHVSDLMDRAGTGDVIVLAWRLFGDAGHLDWPGETLPAFTACMTEDFAPQVSYKSMFRFRKFAAASCHMPLEPRIAEPWVRAADGGGLPNDQLYKVDRIRFKPHARAYRPQAACVNHYAVRSRDVFLMKNHRGRAWGLEDNGKYHLNSHWHRLANRNEAQDRSILRHWPATQAEMARLRTLPGVAEAEAACRTGFSALRDRLLTPENLTRWTKGIAA